MIFFNLVLCSLAFVGIAGVCGKENVTSKENVTEPNGNQTRSERQYWLKLKNNTNNRVVFGANQANQASGISNFCRTPDNYPGQCTDVRNCIWLVFDLNKFRQSVCFKNMFIPGVCCPIRNFDDLNNLNNNANNNLNNQNNNLNNNLNNHPNNNKFVSSSNFLRPGSVEQVGNKPMLKPSSNRPPSFHLTESSNFLDFESSTKPPLTTVFSPFKDYFTTEKKVFYFKTTTPASNSLNEVVDNAASNPKPATSTVTGVEKTLQECGIGGRDSRIVGGTESAPGQWPWMAAIFLHRPYRSPE